ncbi:hypothetical protein ACEWY4_024888 [Coilia grayii]|uniref:Ig-like domain-containing protein n=1 Tax=Coilia grayii TaxID=363190 RepID=A0ABD1IW86_9TELE
MSIPSPGTLFNLTVPHGPVPAQQGSSVVLPCQLHPRLNAAPFHVHWYRSDDVETTVLLYEVQKIQEASADPQYRGRASLVGDLEKGDVSLKLENLTLADRGGYVCFVKSDVWYERASMSVTMKDATGLVSVRSWLLVSPSKSEWISCSVHLSDEEMRESRLLPQSTRPQTETPDTSGVWKAAFVTTLVLALLGLGLLFLSYRKGQDFKSTYAYVSS